MAAQYLNKTGLTYLWGRITALFVAKETGKGLSTNDLTDALVTEIEKISTIETQVNGLVTTGGEPNVIESVKVNGTALTVENKSVDVSVPVQSVEVNGTALTPDANGAVNVQVVQLDKSNGRLIQGWLDSSENGSEWSLMPTSTGAKLTFGTESGGVMPDSAIHDLPDETRVSALISAAVGNITGFNYQKVDALPQTGEAGTIYLVPNSGNAPNVFDEYIYVNKGTTETPDMAFEKIGTTELDLTNYLQSSDIEAITTAEIDEITGA